MITTRRKLLSLLAAGAVVAPALLTVNRSIFLPPRGGWARWSIAQMIIPKSDLPFYSEGIANGTYAYDEATETMSLFKRDNRHQNDRWNSPNGRKYGGLVDGYPADRANIDDAFDKPPEVPPEVRAKEIARLVEKYSHPACNLPQYFSSPDPLFDAKNWGPPDLVASLKADAMARGVPLVGDSIVVDMERWLKTEDYRQWLHI